MSVEVAVRARLLADAGVTSRVSTRIYTLKLPDTVIFPTIRIQLIDHPQDKHLRGPNGTTRARIQIDVYALESAADPYGSLSLIGDDVTDALVYEPFTTAVVSVQSAERLGRTISREADELNLLRMRQDFYVWSRAVN